MDLRSFPIRATLSITTALVGVAECEAAASTPAKIATSIIEDASVAVLDSYATQAKALRKLLDQAFDTTDAKLEAGTANINDTAQIFVALDGFQGMMTTAILDRTEQFTKSFQNAIQVLEGAAIPVKDYPKGFHYGDDGICDRFHADFEAAIAEQYVAVAKRLKKTELLFLQKIDVRMCSRVIPPTSHIDACVVGAAYTTYEPRPLSIDVALSASYGSISSDGRIYVAGGCSNNDTSLNLKLVKIGVFQTTALIPTTDNRWLHTLPGLAEGNYQVAIFPPGTEKSGFGLQAIGVR